MTLVLTIDQLRDVVGREVAVSDWIEVSQTIIDEFAEATRDAQWIHVDTERAARESPFLDSAGRRCTVAHGFLTLSLLTYNGLHRDECKFCDEPHHDLGTNETPDVISTRE